MGTGYTDHCPNCLWSKHVDINPGDRQSQCRGLMEPVGARLTNGEWKIYYCCQKCSYTHFNKAAAEDNMETIIKLSTRPIPL